MIAPETATKIQGVLSFMPNARMSRIPPEAKSASPNKKVRSTAASTGFWKVVTPAKMYNAPSRSQRANLPQVLIWNALNTSAIQATTIMAPTRSTLAAVAVATLPSATTPTIT